MLIKNELSIQEISESLGYADVSHFSRAFKNWTGVTPKAFRK
ncbi:helix-turn-helix domain-containing protein [Acinetobacter junii]